jgi:hypothetical protein
MVATIQIRFLVEANYGVDFLKKNLLAGETGVRGFSKPGERRERQADHPSPFRFSTCQLTIVGFGQTLHLGGLTSELRHVHIYL